MFYELIRPRPLRYTSTSPNSYTLSRRPYIKVPSGHSAEQCGTPLTQWSLWLRGQPLDTLFAYHLLRPTFRLRPRSDPDSFPYLSGRRRSVTGQTYNNQNTKVKCCSKKSCKSLIITEKNLHTEFKWLFSHVSLLYYNT